MVKVDIHCATHPSLHYAYKTLCGVSTLGICTSASWKTINCVECLAWKGKARGM